MTILPFVESCLVCRTSTTFWMTFISVERKIQYRDECHPKRFASSAEMNDTVQSVTGRRLDFLDRRAKRRRIAICNQHNEKMFVQTNFV